MTTGHLVLATMHSANCTEALTRICMLFSPEIQGSIRAHLADCVVGVVCQRLEFMESRKIRVPLCELLIANSSAKATIRSGQLSNLTNVIQAGADDGMWTFERYQHWLRHRTGWNRQQP